MDSIRKEFEDWLRSQPHVLNVGFSQVTGKYLLAEDETAWQAWQASRKCIVIELPPSIGVTPIGGDGIQEYIDCNGEYLHGFAVVESIISAGLTLK